MPCKGSGRQVGEQQIGEQQVGVQQVGEQVGEVSTSVGNSVQQVGEHFCRQAPSLFGSLKVSKPQTKQPKP